MASAPQPTLRFDDGDRRAAEAAPLGRLHRWRARAMALLWFIAIVLVAAPFPFDRAYSDQPGELARADVNAPHVIKVVDYDELERKREELILNKREVWERQVAAESLMKLRLQNFLERVGRPGPRSGEQQRQLALELNNTWNIALTVNTVSRFLPSSLSTIPTNLDQVGKRLQGILDRLLTERFIVSSIASYKADAQDGVLVLYTGTTQEPVIPDPGLVLGFPVQVREYLDRVLLPEYFPGPDYAQFRTAAYDLLMAIIEPNIVYNRERTQAQLDQALVDLETTPPERVWQDNELIVERGQPIGRIEAAALARINAESDRLMFAKTLGIMLIVIAFFGAVAIYLKRFRRDMTLDAATITLLVLPTFFALFAGEALRLMDFSDDRLMVWFPSAAVGMLASILIAPQVAFVLVLVTAILFGLSSDLSLRFVIMALFGGFAAVLASRDIRGRIDIVRVGFKVGVVNALAIFVLMLLDPNWLPLVERDAWSQGLRLAAAGFGNGIASALATLILLVLFEWMFGIVTDLRLLELTGLKHPLIRQLEQKAPGTYQHTLNVAKLAEAAAESIGANTLLVRAGTYFHDIGKMVKPKYFSENQVTLDDKKAHSRLSPYMSVLIIKNHVKEGMELARQFKLPQKVADFIPQHHGSGLIRYFYTQAMRRYEESGAVDPVREEDFRYPGPRPQSVETALVLIADSVEAIASSRFTGGQVSEGELRRTVQSAITERFNDGQFDECDLTMSHLQKIREALVHALMARYHFRIAYPATIRREPPRSDPREAPAAAPIAVAGPTAS